MTHTNINHKDLQYPLCSTLIKVSKDNIQTNYAFHIMYHKYSRHDVCTLLDLKFQTLLQNGHMK